MKPDWLKISIIIILVAGFFIYRWWDSHDTTNFDSNAERFATVFAATTVAGELYRNEPERFFRVRDSIFEATSYNMDSIDSFRQRLEGQEEKWSRVWTEVFNQIDSLTRYYKINPIKHFPIDSLDSLIIDSLPGASE